MDRKKAASYTLGCKLNQFETISLEEELVKAGYTIVPFEDKADLYIINTCTVTSKGDYHSRMKIRQATKTNPDAIVVATGCSAQVNPQRLAGIAGVDLVLGNAEKGHLLEYLDTLEKRAVPQIRVSDLSQNTPFYFRFINHFCTYTRAFLKIQDGCNNHCSYCIVPRARGGNRSAGPATVLEQAGRLIESGYKELVLTGIHLGTYGCDLEERVTLAGLLQALLNSHPSMYLRLSSIEPTEFTPELKELVSTSFRISPHLHIPLQSADDDILEKMNRPYTSAFYRNLIEDLISIRPGIAIGADVIVGFPGETEENFEKTYRFIDSLPLAYLHVFSFSPRPGTQAAHMPRQVDGLVKHKRCSLLRGLGKGKFYSFKRKFIGKELSALVLGLEDEKSKNQVAITENYIKVVIPQAESLVNHRVIIKIREVLEDRTLGELVAKEM